MTITLHPHNFALRSSGGMLDSRATDPPVFTVAPTSVSLPSSGGTIQFSASNSVSYSLTSTRQGITINSSTGLVTVSSLASGSTGNIIVQATNSSGAYAETTCSVTVEAYVSSGNWQLAAGHYVSAKLPPQVVFPRPDNNPLTGQPETNTWARHRKAYPGLLYQVPIGINHGAWPFRFELIEGPTGMTVGEEYGAPNYGIVSWTPAAAAASQPVRVRVYDQDYNRGSSPIDVTWTVTATTTGFIFVDPNAVDDIGSGGSGSLGSINNPFKTSRGWFKGDEQDATYDGYHVIWRGGTHYLYFSDTPTSTSWAPDDGKTGLGSYYPWKPRVWYAYPGEDVCLNFSGTDGVTWYGSQVNVDVAGHTELGCADWYVADFRIEHSMRKKSQHFWFFYAQTETLMGTESDSTPTANGYRVTFWRNRWRYHYPSNCDTVTYTTKPASAGENASAVWAIQNTAPAFINSYRRFWYFADNEYRDFSTYDPDTGILLWSDNGCEVAQMCNTYCAVAERNTITGTFQSRRLGFHKTGLYDSTYRANDFWVPSDSTVDVPWTVNTSQGYGTAANNGNLEVCWNRVYRNGTATADNSLAINDSNSAVPLNPVWVYRNTVHGGDTRSACRTLQDVGIWESNVFITVDSNAFYLNAPTQQSGNLILLPTSTNYDLATGNLVATSARGTVGHEVL